MIEQHRVDAADGQVGVRVHVVVVGHRLDAVRALRRGEQLPGQRPAQRRDLASGQILQRAEALAVALAHRDHLAELVVRDAHRQLGALGRRVFDAAQRDVEVAALDRLIERGEGRLDELRAAGRAPRRAAPATSTSKPRSTDGIVGIGLDEGRAALGVTAPAEHVRLAAPSDSRPASHSIVRISDRASHVGRSIQTQRLGASGWETRRQPAVLASRHDVARHGARRSAVEWAMTAGPQQPAAPFTATTNLVVVPAVVLDKRGQPVTGLTAADFQVREDGAPMAIEAFVAPDAAGAGADGRLLVLVLDNLNTPVELGARVRRIATMFVDRMTPADTLSVISLDAGRAFTTGNPKELRAQIDRFRPRSYLINGLPQSHSLRRRDRSTLRDLSRPISESRSQTGLGSNFELAAQHRNQMRKKRALAVFAKHVVHPERSEKNGVSTQPFHAEEAPDEAPS